MPCALCPGFLFLFNTFVALILLLDQLLFHCDRSEMRSSRILTRDGSGMKYPAPYRLLWTIAVILFTLRERITCRFWPSCLSSLFRQRKCPVSPVGWVENVPGAELVCISVETRAVLFVRALSAVSKLPIHESTMWAQLEHQAYLEVIRGIAFASGRAGRWSLTRCLDAGKQVCPTLAIICR
jgi:hypothetical protein